nr:hypothetical protein [Escherichia coli]
MYQLETRRFSVNGGNLSGLKILIQEMKIKAFNKKLNFHRVVV